MDPHRLAEERSIAMHAAIAARMTEAIRARALERIRTGDLATPYRVAWEAWLALPLDELREKLIHPGEHARALRQVTPFAGVLGPRERWQIRRSVG